MIRSANRNDTTPPKLMPPLYSTAASGTFPIEQTKLSIAMIGPTSGPHTFDQRGMVGQEQRLPERVRHPGGHGTGDQQADDDVADHGRPLHDEDVADRRQPSRR